MQSTRYLLRLQSNCKLLDRFWENIEMPNFINPLNAELNPIRHFIALAGAHHFVHVSRIRVKIHPVEAELFRADRHPSLCVCSCR
jgi:hypothetical protein